MDLGTIRPINIDVEMQASYLDYAMSVIVARALPDVRDGLKPVHRRILYAMYDLGLYPDRPYKKSARVVGEVLGKYHPHGDAAVYEAMVRMAQDFSLRYPLVDGQGNFGSIDGDNAAAMRYTEVRLAPISNEMLADIEKDTVDWTENFDGTLKEPTVLPAALPNLIVNGSSGIAVGMSTNIPPHNLGEVCDALCYLIDHYKRAEEVPVEDLMQFIPGPDFPTGGLIYRYQHENGADGEEQVDVIARAYASGKGRVVVQAKAHIEDMSRNRSRIVVTELPYQTNKTNLLERIAELVRDGRLEGVTDLRDESDRTGMRICIEMTRTVEPRDVLSDLYKLTPLQSTFGISLLALVDGEPRLLSLKRLLLHFLEHRQEVIRRRSAHDLAKALQRKEILEGLLRALDMLDEVIALIRGSRTADTAKKGLIDTFKFTELQAQAILDMQLRRLAALERRKLQDEYKETLALIKELEELLGSPEKVLKLIRKNLTDLKATYNDPRRTQIADRVKGTLTTIDVLPDQEVWVTLGTDGMLARRPVEGMDAGGARRLAANAGVSLFSTNTLNDLYLFSAKGQAARVPVHQAPDGAGTHFADLSGLNRRDRVAAVCAAPKPQADGGPEGFVTLGTAQGKVKRIALSELVAQAHADPQVINVDAGDELAWADMCTGGGEIMLLTARGQVIRFAEDDVRVMGLPAGGIGGIKLAANDRVVAGICVPAGTAGDTLLALVTARGWGKRSPLSDFPLQGRYGQGVLAGRPTERSGLLAGLARLGESDAVFIRIDGGPGRLLAADQLPVSSRSAQGKALFQPASGESACGVQGVAGLPVAPSSGRSSAGTRTGGEPAARPARTRATRTTAAAQPSLLPPEEAAGKPPAAPARRRVAKAAAAVAVAGGAAKATATRRRAATSGPPAAPPAEPATKERTPASSSGGSAKAAPTSRRSPASKSATTTTAKRATASSAGTRAADAASKPPDAPARRRVAKAAAAVAAAGGAAKAVATRRKPATSKPPAASPAEPAAKQAAPATRRSPASKSAAAATAKPPEPAAKKAAAASAGTGTAKAAPAARRSPASKSATAATPKPPEPAAKKAAAASVGTGTAKAAPASRRSPASRSTTAATPKPPEPAAKKAASADKETPEASTASGARVYSRADLPRLMPAPSKGAIPAGTAKSGPSTASPTGSAGQAPSDDAPAKPPRRTRSPKTQ